MYVCTCGRVDVWTWVRVYVATCLCLHVCARGTYVRVYLCTCVRVYVCTCERVYVCTCGRVSMCRCVGVQVCRCVGV